MGKNQHWAKHKKTNWQKISDEEISNTKKILNYLENTRVKPTKISIINRSLVFDNERIGPDISWVVPPGFRWNINYKFDITTRGHNSAMDWEKNRNLGIYGNRKIFGWNKGDAVALIS